MDGLALGRFLLIKISKISYHVPPFGFLLVRVRADLLVAGAALGLERCEECLSALCGGELAALLLVPDALALGVLFEEEKTRIGKC